VHSNIYAIVNQFHDKIYSVCYLLFP
jgi:hypothetical protein